ncbi:hypothetical protein QF117_15465 [Vibrio sp. YMD68]|uniref:hypothetical protein n=1 Tax=Vibrio sp. YMD68 TaxID=3042300 RepID=UPI00249C5890|nr:hypothetical protein [Vibrio sp. YMD68]WGV99338.1 hypothetical protein QF117_15465 [Vibrio sp. YMD68]
MKKFPTLMLFACAPVQADVVASIEKFTDIFSISASSVDNDVVYTLDGNYYLTENLRVFGDIDTDSQWEIGLGYSFWSNDDFYTENTVSANSNTYSTGLFLAKSINESWLVISDVNFNYRTDINDPLCYFDEICNGNQLSAKYVRSHTVDYSLGGMWSPISFFDLLYKFNHEVGIDRNELEILSYRTELQRTNFNYHEASMLFNIGFLKPSITYTFGKQVSDNYVEFGLAFSF